MKIKPLRTLLILLTLLIALGFGGSIQARAEAGMVVQITNTPPPGPTVVPIVVSTPLPDGTVKHIIAGGQSLWGLSDAYDVPFQELLDLNDLDPDVILKPGDEVIIAPSYTPTSTPIGEPSATPPPRYTHTPSPEPTESSQEASSPASPVPTETNKTEARFIDTVKSPAVIVTAIVVSGGSLGAALYFSLRKMK